MTEKTKKPKFHKGDILLSLWHKPIFIVEAKGGYYHYDQLCEVAEGDLLDENFDCTAAKYEQLEANSQSDEPLWVKVGEMTERFKKKLRVPKES